MKLDSRSIPQIPSQALPAGGRRVLVLDDDADVLYLFASTLTRAGYAVDIGADGEQGWEALCATDYSLLVTDNDMPRLTGIELVERLRHAGLTLPVLIAFGSMVLPGRAGLAQTGLGLVEVLRKPITLDELTDAVQYLLPLPQAAPEIFSRREAPAAELMSPNQRRRSEQISV